VEEIDSDTDANSNPNPDPNPNPVPIGNDKPNPNAMEEVLLLVISKNDEVENKKVAVGYG
jgi:hypothetical protein